MTANALLDETTPAVPRALPTVARVGLLGCGVVGSAVARALLENAEEVAAVAGAKLELTRVAVRHPAKHRPVDLPAGVLSDDAFAIVRDPTVDLVVEVIGGVDLPKRLIETALRSGKSVVTANKELLALHGRELAATSEDHGVDLLFEGAVGGAIPIVSTLRDRLRTERKTRVSAVVNGTTNFVLGLMDSAGCSQEEAVARARKLGYAEADPRADLDGSDAAAKTAILASLAFGGWVTTADVRRTGIDRVRPEDLSCARELGYSVKLLATAERAEGVASFGVAPTLVEGTSSLGSLTGATNEVVVECSGAGQLSFRGAGAGGDATASAVVGDVATATRNLLTGRRSPLVSDRSTDVVVSRRETASRHFFRVDAGRWVDAPAVVTTASERAGVRVEATSCVSVGEAVHVGVLCEKTTRRRAESARRALCDLGFPPGLLLPVAEVV